jgi:hypothetical protein
MRVGLSEDSSVGEVNRLRCFVRHGREGTYRIASLMSSWLLGVGLFGQRSQVVQLIPDSACPGPSDRSPPVARRNGWLPSSRPHALRRLFLRHEENDEMVASSLLRVHSDPSTVLYAASS